MSYLTPLETRLGALISAYADRAPVSVDPMAMTRLSAAAAAGRSPSLLRPTRDWAYFGLVLALLVALAAGALAVAGQMLFRESDNRLTDRVLVAPFDGLPPDGAPPSTPLEGQPVMSFVGRVNVIGHDVHAMWVYDDGRLIWKRNLDSSKADKSVFGAIGPTTGLLEQRLTPEGIRLLRSAILTPDAMIGDNWGHGLGVEWGEIRVRIDGRMTGVHWTSRVLPGRLADPSLWLPATAWADARIGAFVASQYTVGFSGDDFDRLPRPVQTVLRANGFQPDRSGAGLPDSFPVSTDAAREIEAVLAHEGRRVELVQPAKRRGPQVHNEPTVAVDGLRFQFGDDEASQLITLQPVLPHGEPICPTCD
jgi:hypothetical protein